MHRKVKNEETGSMPFHIFRLWINKRECTTSLGIICLENLCMDRNRKPPCVGVIQQRRKNSSRWRFRRVPSYMSTHLPGGLQAFAELVYCINCYNNNEKTSMGQQGNPCCGGQNRRVSLKKQQPAGYRWGRCPKGRDTTGVPHRLSWEVLHLW